MSVLTEKDVKYEYRNSYQTVKAVGGVSCEFEQGKVYAIVGSSGSGKTTFLSLLAGLDKPTEGEIDFGVGYRPRQLPPRPRVGDISEFQPFSASDGA
mgnify:CR=1 FL=1